MDGDIQQVERDKVVLELFWDSFSHVVKYVKDELVLEDIQPKFPDLDEEYKQSLAEDEKYVNFKKKREELVTRWNQHINCAKKANTKAHECQQVLKRIWNLRKKFKINIESIKVPLDEQENKYLEQLKVLVALEQLLKSENSEQNKLQTQTTDGQTPTASKEHMEEHHHPDKWDVISKADSDSDNDDIQTTDNPRQRERKIEDGNKSHKDEKESNNSGAGDTKSSKPFIENKEELERNQPMDTSDTNNVEVTKMDTDDRSSMETSKRLEELEKLQKTNEKLQTKLDKKRNDLKKIDKDLKIRNNEVAGMSNQIAELEKKNHDLEDQIKRFSPKDTEFENTESLLKEANATIQTLKDENDRIQAKYKPFKDLNDQLTDQIQCLTDENESISRVLKLPEEKTRKMVTALQKELNEEVKQKEKLSQLLAKMQRPKTAPGRQYREMQTLVDTLKCEKESLMQRLSKVAGMKMKDNNPAIADLSDPNRPEKLSEKFREIYDNAWTNLLDTITEKTGESDDICVKQIVSALMMMYDTSKNTITSNKREMAKLLGYPEDCFDTPYAGGKEGHDPVLKTLKDLIQVSVTRQSVAITKNIKEFPEIKTILKVGGKNGDAFITECLQLCFYMCTQDPPVVLDFSCKSGDAFNKDKFTPFTKSGAIVDYLVWPVMYLSDNGAIMSKGIAQGK